MENSSRPESPPLRALASRPRGLSGRDLHRRRARAPRAARHEPRPPGVRARQPPRDGQGRAVRPLLALPGHAAAAVPRRVRRLAPRGRPAVGRRRGRPRRRSSTSASSSATATTRSRSSAARTSRASGSRTCSRRCSSARASAAYLEQSTRYIAYDAPMPGGGYRYYRDPSLGPEYERAMDELFDDLRREPAEGRRVGRRAVPAARRRAERGARARDPGQGARPPARPAARRVAVAHGHLRDRPDLRAADPPPARAPAARGARATAA